MEESFLFSSAFLLILFAFILLLESLFCSCSDNILAWLLLFSFVDSFPSIVLLSFTSFELSFSFSLISFMFSSFWSLLLILLFVLLLIISFLFLISAFDFISSLFLFLSSSSFLEVFCLSFKEGNFNFPVFLFLSILILSSVSILILFCFLLSSLNGIDTL